MRSVAGRGLCDEIRSSHTATSVPNVKNDRTDSLNERNDEHENSQIIQSTILRIRKSSRS